MNHYVLENEMRWRHARLQKDVERSRLVVEAMRRRSRARRPALVVQRVTRRIAIQLRHSPRRGVGDEAAHGLAPSKQDVRSMSVKPRFGFALEYVTDIDAVRRFYVDVLGLEVDREHPTFRSVQGPQRLPLRRR